MTNRQANTKELLAKEIRIGGSDDKDSDDGQRDHRDQEAKVVISKAIISKKI